MEPQFKKDTNAYLAKHGSGTLTLRKLAHIPNLGYVMLVVSKIDGSTVTHIHPVMTLAGAVAYIQGDPNNTPWESI